MKFVHMALGNSASQREGKHHTKTGHSTFFPSEGLDLWIAGLPGMAPTSATGTCTFRLGKRS